MIEGEPPTPVAYTLTGLIYGGYPWPNPLPATYRFLPGSSRYQQEASVDAGTRRRGTPVRAWPCGRDQTNSSPALWDSHAGVGRMADLGTRGERGRLADRQHDVVAQATAGLASFFGCLPGFLGSVVRELNGAISFQEPKNKALRNSLLHKAL